ncbi:MAG: DUF2784 family protein [Caulobacteraceae bacterium]
MSWGLAFFQLGGAPAAAQAMLALHLAVILFNIFGLVVVPIGAWRRWRFVREPIWRVLHLLSLAVTAGQAILGRICFLTALQAWFSGAEAPRPLIMRFVNSLVYLPLPFWVFEDVYVAVFAYALALLWFVPPRGLDLRSAMRRSGSGRAQG